MFYIYLTTNNINGKKYIGQHKGEPNDSYLGSGCNITKAILKYGKENFTKEILKICDTDDELNYWEKYYIDYFNAIEDDNFYNLQEGGIGGDGWRAFRQWAREHPEEAQKIWEENGKRLKQWQIDHPIEYQEKVIKPFLKGAEQWRKDHPEEMAKHMEEVNKAKEKWQKENPEKHKKQVDDWQKQGSIANSQKVLCITTGEIFES